MSEPLLLLKTGVPGAETDGLYPALAQTYKAEIVSTDAIRLDMGRGKLITNREMNRAVNQHAGELALQALTQGTNVLYGGYLNTPERRAHVMETVAIPAGATVLDLCIDADWNLVLSRLEDRYETDELSIPAKALPSFDSYVGNIYGMHLNVSWTSRQERIPFEDFDGWETISDVITKIDDRFGLDPKPLPT